MRMQQCSKNRWQIVLKPKLLKNSTNYKCLSKDSILILPFVTKWNRSVFGVLLLYKQQHNLNDK
jgi:hypothetical protein